MFKVGDRVRLLRDWDGSFLHPLKGEIGTVTNTHAAARMASVDFEGFNHAVDTDWLEVIAPAPVAGSLATEVVSHSEALTAIEHEFGLSDTEPRKVLEAMRKLQAENAALKAERDKSLTLKRIFEHDAEIHEAQYLLERENSKRLASALMHAAPEAWNAIKDTLNQSNNERDKVYCEVSKRFNRLIEVEAERDALAAALAFYADDDDDITVYSVHSDDDGELYCYGAINHDKGDRARLALAAVGKTVEGGE